MASLPGDPGLPQSVRLAVSPLSWTNDVLADLGGDIPLETCLDEAAAAGFAGMELGRKFPREAGVLGPLLGARGLALASGWHSGRLAAGSVADELAAVAPHATLLQTLGARVMVYGETALFAGPDRPFDAAFSERIVLPRKEVAPYAARLTAFARALMDGWGLRLACHHHLMTIAETFDEIAAILGHAGPEVGLLLDTGHAAGAGFDYTRLIAGFGPRIVHIHLKDHRRAVLDALRARDGNFNDGVRAGMFAVPGDGDLDFAPLARFVRESGYRGWLVVEAEQDPARVPPRAAVTRARAHILDLLARTREAHDGQRNA